MDDKIDSNISRQGHVDQSLQSVEYDSHLAMCRDLATAQKLKTAV